MLSHRLLLGPLLIAAVVLLGWLDAAVEGALAPAWLRPALLGAETVPGGAVVFLVLLALGIVGAVELASMARRGGSQVSGAAMGLCAALGLIGTTLPAQRLDDAASGAIPATFGALALGAALFEHARRRDAQGAMQSVGAASLAFLWLGMAPAFYALMRRDHGVEVIVGAILLVKVCDIGAYFTGMAIGRRKLIPWLSPGKTWEGLVGGLLWAALIGAAGAWAFEDHSPITPGGGAIAGAALGLTGQGADLFESLLKRGAGVKDSGRVPGFGGVLDLLDSPLLAGPVAYWLAIALL